MEDDEQLRENIRFEIEEAARKRLSALMHRVILIGSVVSGVIALIIICAVVYLSTMTDHGVPDILGNWGGLILGFYFGTLFGLVKDWMQSAVK